MEPVADYSCGSTVYPHGEPRGRVGWPEGWRLKQAKPVQHRQSARHAAVTTESSPAPRDEACDSRYRTIIGRIDALLAKLQGEPASNLTADLDRLLRAMNDHFSTEESAMMLVRFPHAETHALSHKAICFGTAKVRYRFSMGDRVTHEELGFLRLLWREHIERYDGALERFLSPEEDRDPLEGACRSAALQRAQRARQ